MLFYQLSWNNRKGVFRYHPGDIELSSDTPFQAIDIKQKINIIYKEFFKQAVSCPSDLTCNWILKNELFRESDRISKNIRYDSNACMDAHMDVTGNGLVQSSVKTIYVGHDFRLFNRLSVIAYFLTWESIICLLSIALVQFSISEIYHIIRGTYNTLHHLPGKQTLGIWINGALGQ